MVAIFWARSALLLALVASPGLCLPQSFWRRSSFDQPPTPTSTAEISTARQDRCPASRRPPKTRTVTNYVSTSAELKELSSKPADLPGTPSSEAALPEETVTITINGTLTRHKIMFPTATEVHTVSYNYTTLLTQARTTITELPGVTTYTVTYWDVTDVDHAEKSSSNSTSAASDNSFILVTSTSSPTPTEVHSSTTGPRERVITLTHWHYTQAASVIELSAKPPDLGPIVTLSVNKTKTNQLYKYPISMNTDDVGTTAIEELTGPTATYTYTYTHLPVTKTYYTTEESYPWSWWPEDTATATPGSTLKSNNLAKRTHRVLLNDGWNDPDHLPSSLVDLSLGTYTTTGAKTAQLTQTVHEPIYMDGSMTTLDYKPTYFPDTTVTVNDTYSWDGVVYPQTVIVSTLLSTLTRADTFAATTISTISTLQSIQTVTQWGTMSWIHANPVPTAAPSSSPDPVQSGVLRLTTWLTEIVTTIYTSALPTNAPRSVDLVYKTVSLAVYKVPGVVETIPTGVFSRTWTGDGPHTDSLSSAVTFTYYTDIYRGPEPTTTEVVTATVTESKSWAQVRPLKPRQQDAPPDDTACTTAASTSSQGPFPAPGMPVTQTAYAVKSTYTVTSIASFAPQCTATTNETFLTGFPPHYVVPRPSGVGGAGAAVTADSTSGAVSQRPSRLSTDSGTRAAISGADDATATATAITSRVLLLPARLFTDGSRGVNGTAAATSVSMVTANWTFDLYPSGYRPANHHTDRVVYRTTTTTLVSCPERMNTTTRPPL
ncbi:uncharacterized protein E0L32_007916 [Thyridium curvatum]|uniref:Uncharacterized protein n=1 Tax=Thyridium curvatum TaxID=1093900 RepID=A0A507AKL6_9PEZI|nr:uncharacterized protein E0L32_007916 [Thyridium curvatum]TPX11055.1 hypothetical protein E0L32_007916 [Thyridium curvatum]